MGHEYDLIHVFLLWITDNDTPEPEINTTIISSNPSPLISS
jgi:hypothetical protein